MVPITQWPQVQAGAAGHRIGARRATVAAVLVGLSWSPPLDAQSDDEASPPRPAPTAWAMRTATAPLIDGRLDDEAWSAAAALSDFVQHEPFEGRPPTERTEVAILYDHGALYIGARMLDSGADGILLGENRRDADLADADALLIVLDTYLDRQNAFVFGTTPVGIEYDGQVTKDGQGGLTTSQRAQTGPGAGGGFNLNWDGSWEVATSIDDRGWYAEFRIPFSTLRYGSGAVQAWGLNVSRIIRRRNEEVFWAPIPRQYTLYRVSEAGTLQGLEAPTRRTVRVTPYALSSAHRDFARAAAPDWSAELGGDAKIGLTPSLNLDLTYNTDFAQVEVDEQQINLTRFSLFFPEKRPFFLENAGIFSVGIPQAGSDLGLDLFYSRRIGIGGDGEPVPLLGGGRVTGKAGGVTVGLLTLQTEGVAAESIPANNYSVGRAVRELPNRSQVGALFVSRLNTDATSDYNLTYALDGRVGIGPGVNLDGYVARTETPGLSGREHAIGFTGSYQTRDWDLGVQYREVGDGFNPEVGFLPRGGYRAFIGRMQRNIRLPALGWLRELRPHILLREFYDFGWFNETAYLHIDNAVAFQNGGSLSTAVNLQREGLKEAFEIAAGVVVPPGTYDFVETRLRFTTNESAVWSLDGDVTVGGFFSGHRKSVAGTLTGRLGSTWAASLRLSYDDVDLDEGSFETALVGLRVAYSFTPRIFLQSLVQYNSQSDALSANVRFGWLDTAGTGLYVVYNEVQRTASPTGPSDRAFIVKFTRQFDLIR